MSRNSYFPPFILDLFIKYEINKINQINQMSRQQQFELSYAFFYLLFFFENSDSGFVCILVIYT
jgi:hypothetical protein